MAGIDSSGFTPKTTEDIKSDLESGFRGVFGAGITVIAQSIFGQIIGIIADRLADLWQLGLALYSGSTREGAEGNQLDDIGALTGSLREAATYSEVTLHLTGVNTTVIPAGRLVSIPNVGTQFTNDDPGVIGVSGVDILFRAVETGPKAAPAGTVTQIDTPVSGWASVTNALDESVLGADIESDAAYRIRQVAELRAQGASTVAAIRAKVREVDNVTEVFVFENSTNTTDANGLPPYSFEAVVEGGTDAAVAKAIADHKPVGTPSYGSTTETTVDDNGFPVDISFSRPEELPIYITVTVTVDGARLPDNADATIKAALAAYEDNYAIGSEVRASALIPSVFASLEAGVIAECSMPFIGTSASPVSSATITVTNRQKAVLDTSRIVVGYIYLTP